MANWLMWVPAIGAAVLLAVSPAAAQPHALKSADRPAPTASQAVRPKSKGRLYARMFLYTDEHAFLEAWVHRSRGLHFKNVSTVARGVQLTVVVAFANCEAGAKGACNAKVDFTVLKPDGSVYAHLKNLDLWSGKKAPRRHVLQLSVDNLHIRIDPTDPLGKYRIKARVRDLNSGKQVTVSKSFTAVAAVPQRKSGAKPNGK